ncbi:disulfide reductase [Candidatus Woesearchaeota archaeon CG11_big_fil_rev_8_21_14_0_20_43_8]|nr:MAG: disulfide reductase [Candidatus Woesearchaeota archaeon CG11_big_fil_rev_8_21_14_0_20_43_8]
MLRIGVFVCHCGNNIAGRVRVEDVAKAAADFPGVLYSTTSMYMCSSEGQGLITDMIKKHNLTKIVVASCSPNLHEKTFRGLAEKNGLNYYSVEIANIREQVSWVHDDIDKATEKAIDIVRMAVAKVSHGRPLKKRSVKVTKRALVIGGGIAGIQAALDLADAGFKVTMVEKEPTIGGKMAMFDKTFPTLDCSMCILTPKMVQTRDHENIELLTFSEVEELDGHVGEFNAKIRKKTRYVDEELCIGCGACEKVCPVKTESTFNQGLVKRKAIYFDFPQAVPKVPRIDNDKCIKCGACAKVCPKKCIRYNQKDEIFKRTFGVVIVATGSEIFDDSAYGEYGYGKIPDVITSLQFERMLVAGGPTDGKVLRPSDGKVPKSVVFIKCVGSRDEKKGYPYCSRVCCMYTAKHVLLLNEHHPGTDIYVFYIDIRSFGKNYEEFVKRVQDETGALYLRGRVSRIFDRDGKLHVFGTDTLTGNQVKVDADMVVLANGLVPAKSTRKIARVLNLSKDTHGWLNELHPKLAPVETATRGVFIAGTCQGPKDIPDAVASGSAAASRAMSILNHSSLELEPTIAHVNQFLCSGCENCFMACPFGAIEMVDYKDPNTKKIRRVAQVIESKCTGCGVCSSVCPVPAIDVSGFSAEDVFVEIEALGKGIRKNDAGIKTNGKKK